jgi:membrane protease YdiL (CAAX protease family)
MLEPPPSPLARYRLAAVIFAMTYPSLLTWVYFTALDDSSGPAQRAAFGIGKLIQFGFPAAWVFFVERRRFGLNQPSTRGLGIALAFGIFELALGFAIYWLWLKPAGVFTEPVKEMLTKLQGFGLDSRAGLMGLGVCYSLVHSWMEEYYWRWFVLNELRRTEPSAQESPRIPIRALVISSFAFAAHHVIVLAGYFGWGSPWTYAFTGAVAIGGLIFGWLYLHSRSLYSAWLAHAFADAVIFLIGYDLLANALK